MKYAIDLGPGAMNYVPNQHTQKSSKILRLILNPPWYVSNKTLHEDPGIP
jgi:hypothetical protein